jgi:HPt (histidine-containing phosphotransfer) domain-containing protein
MEQQLQAELSTQITSLRSACQDADHDGMRDHLHQLKGISDYFRQTGIRRACDSLHQALTEDDRPAVLAVLDQLDAIVEPRQK